MRQTSLFASWGTLALGLVLMGADAAHAGPAERSALSGEWIASVPHSGELLACTLKLTRKGRFTLVALQAIKGTKYSRRGTYAADGRNISFRDSKGGQLFMTYKLSDKKLTLVLGVFEIPLSKSTAAGTHSARQDQPTGDRNIVVNGVRLTGKQLRVWEDLERKHRVRLPDRRYWYDQVTGYMGYDGGPSKYQILSRPRLGGKLSPKATGGRTGFFVNGLELHPVDVNWYRRLFGRAPSGRYWLLSDGRFGVMGDPRPLCNIYDIARKRARNSDGGGRKESLTSGYFLTGVAVIGGEVLIR